MSRKEVMWFSGFVFLWLFPYFATIILNGMDMAFLNRMPDAEDLLPAALCVQIPKDYENSCNRSAGCDSKNKSLAKNR